MRPAEAVANTFAYPDGSMVYRQSPPGRFDCSSYVATCWGILVPVNTVSLVTDRWMVELGSFDELLPGDAVGLCGPGTAGDAGHIQMITGRTQTGWTIAEMTPPRGPTHRTVKGITKGYRPYRLVGMGENVDPELAQMIRDIHWALFLDALPSARPPGSLVGMVRDVSPASPGGVAEHKHDPGGVTRAGQ